MTTRPRILVVYKKDAYTQYIEERRDPHLLRLLRKKHPDVLEMRRAHVVHQQAIEVIVRELRSFPVQFDLADRAGLKVEKRYDLVISVGGDGTFLQAARSVYRTPILAINSDPLRSEAVFAAATCQTFVHYLRRALTGRLPELSLYRLQLSLNGEALKERAINDVLIVHNDPATMSRYRFKIGRTEEMQKSSGLWVSTAAGSSSAVLAAGGVRLQWGEKKFQYRPREIYRGKLSYCRLTGGVLLPDERVQITWLMRRGIAFIDGPHVKIPLQFADRLEIKLSLSEPLHVLGLEHR